MTSKPNIIMLVLDTQRADHMSMYGYQKDTTPVLEDFSQNCTIFDQAIAPAPWTVPSHSSMFTGVYPTVHQTNQSYASLPSDIPTVAELLSREGYDTVGFCNNPLVSILENGLKRGFDEFYNYSGTFADVPAMDDAPMSRKIQRQITSAIQGLANPITRQFGQSPLLLRLAMMPLFVPFWTRLGKFKGDTRQSLRDITDYLRYRNNNRSGDPFFMFINMMETHLPYYPPRKHLEQWVPYLKTESDLRHFIGRFNTESYRWVAPMIDPFTSEEQQVLNDVYDAEVAYQDQHLRKVFRYLKRSGMLDNTMVIVVADHGESHGDHGFMGHAFVNYNEVVRVPLFIHYPETFPAGQRVAHNVSTRRIFHTILDTAGVHHEGFGFSSNNLSLARSVSGAEAEDETVIAEAYPPMNFINVMEANNPSAIEEFRVNKLRRAIYDGPRKLMTIVDEPIEFFNTTTDPLEAHNLLDGTPAHAASILKLEQALAATVTTLEAHRLGISAGAQQDYSDNPELIERLRGLGYIE